MSADQLRLLLLILGVLLIAGIYFWDRLKGQRLPWPGRRRRRRPARRQPTLGDDLRPERDAEMDDGLLEDDAMTASDERQRLDQGWDEILADREPSLSAMPLDPAADAVAPPYLTPAELGKLPQLILMVHVESREEALSGEQILRAAAEVGLQPGPMAIFHRLDTSYPDTSLFSMANMVEPGTFPFNDMAGFRSPGLTLFAQLPTVREGASVYADMLHAAQRLAALLGGELTDEAHNPLRKQTIEHARQRVREHHRQVMLQRGA